MLWRRAVQMLLILWAAELVLARFSSEPLEWPDVAASCLVPLVLGVGVLPILMMAPIPERRRRTLLGLLGGCPVAIVAMGIAVPILVHEGRMLLAVGATAAAGVVVSHPVRRSSHHSQPFPSPSLVLGVLAGATSLAWLVQPSGFPPPAVWLPILLAWGVLRLLVAGPGWLLAVGAMLAVAVARLPAPEPRVNWSERNGEPSGPDIVLLTVDTLRVDAAGEMGSHRRLGRQGVVFQAAQAPAPWTLPSMASLLTGLEPEHHGARRLGSGEFSSIRREVPTLASRLAERGYDTAAVVGANTFLGSGFGFQRGFDVFLHASEANRFALPRLAGGLNPARPLVADWATSRGLLGLPSFWNADHLVDLALAVLRQRRQRPLFLWIHFFDCHLPYREADGADLPWDVRLALDSARGRGTFVHDSHWSTPLGRATLRDAYRHEVRRVDRAIGRLLDRLGPAPEAGRLIALTSDHGEEFFEHGGFEHGHALYQEVVAVPLVLAGLPGDREQGRIEATPVDLQDLAITLLRAADATEASLVGRGLVGALAPRVLVSRNLLYGGPPDDRFAVRDGRWKLIVERGGADRLYDLEQDPNEIRNLAAAQPDTTRRLAAAWSPPMHSTEPVQLGAREEAALRALGYLDE